MKAQNEDVGQKEKHLTAKLRFELTFVYIASTVQP